MTHNLYVALSKSASVCWYSELRKKVCVLQRASTEATWITAPEVSRKAVNINDSYHPSPPTYPPPPTPGFLQPNSRHFCADFSLEQEYSEARNHVVSPRNLGLHSRF